MNQGAKLSWLGSFITAMLLALSGCAVACFALNANAISQMANTRRSMGVRSSAATCGLASAGTLRHSAFRARIARRIQSAFARGGSDRLFDGCGVGVLGAFLSGRRMLDWLPLHQRRGLVIKMSDVCILLAVMVSFAISGYLWFAGQKEAGLFTATWVPAILCFGIYFKVLTLKAQADE